MRTLKLTIAYDGTDFAGWQRQANARTVQASIEDALSPIAGQRVVITGAGRTDPASMRRSGCQLLAVVVHRGRRITACAERELADDVRVMAVTDARHDFNARFDARSRRINIRSICDAVDAPQLRRYAWHVPQALDAEAMNEAAALLLGEHDFAAFQAAGGEVITGREVIASKCTRGRSQRDRPTLVYCSHGHRLSSPHGPQHRRHARRHRTRATARPTSMRAILASRDRAHASATAPPHGLTLWSVDYRSTACSSRSAPGRLAGRQTAATPGTAATTITSSIRMAVSQAGGRARPGKLQQLPSALGGPVPPGVSDERRQQDRPDSLLARRSGRGD